MISRGTGKLKKYLTRWFQTSSRLPSLTVTRTVDAKNSIKKLLCSNLHEKLDSLLQINPTRENIVIKHNRYNVEQFYRLKTMAPPTDKMTTTSQKNFRRGAKFSRPREVQIWNKVICQHCRKYLLRENRAPMKYQPLRLVSWVNSTQCSFKPIKRLRMSNINRRHQPAGFGLVLKGHLRCIFWEDQIELPTAPYKEARLYYVLEV